MKTALLVTLLPAMAAAADGVVVRVGDASAPGVASQPAGALVKALGLEAAVPVAVEDAKAALAELLRGEKLYTQKGELSRAIDVLQKARARLPVRLQLADRPAALRGLWLLAQLLAQSDRVDDPETTAALDRGLLVDPTAEPPLVDYSPKMRTLFNARRERFLLTAHTITARQPGWNVICRVRIDGVERGQAGTPLGPFPPGTYVVTTDCGRPARWQHTVRLGAEDVTLDVPAFTPDLEIVDGGLVLARDAGLRDLAARVLAATDAPWVLAATPTTGGVGLTLYRRGVAAQDTSGPVAPGDAQGWLAKLLSGAPAPVAGPDAPVQLAGGPRWWHWALIGGGVALAGTGGVFHALAYGAADEMKDGTVDNRDAVSRDEALAVTFYALGGAALATGAVLAILGRSDGEGTVIVPGPGGVSLLGRF